MNAIALLVEKALWTYVQAFIATLLVGAAMDVSTAQAAAVAAIPAFLTVIANGLPAVPAGLPFYLDLLLRIIRTYAVSFLGYLVAVPTFTLDFSIAQAAATAGIPAILALLKGAAASRIGDHSTPATLPARLDPPPLEPAPA